MEEAPIIDGDVPCENCKYNLRGLPADRACPECGQEPRFSAPMDAAENANDLRRYFRARPLLKTAAQAGYPVDALLFVGDVIRFLHADQALRGQIRHVGARQVCDGLRDYAFQYFNDTAEAMDLLGEWGLRRSEDVGRVVFALVRAGELQARAEDREEDFAGLFELERLFAGPVDQGDDEN